MPVFALASHDSCSTSQTGTSSIGARCAKPIPERWHNSFHTEGKLGHRLIQHTKNEEKAVRWMPEL